MAYTISYGLRNDQKPFKFIGSPGSGLFPVFIVGAMIVPFRMTGRDEWICHLERISPRNMH
jgi:hypothetical protein